MQYHTIQTSHYQSLNEAITTQSKQNIDGIIISTPTPTHSSLITQAAKSGISIFTEKPIDETESKVRDLYKVTNDHGVELCFVLIGW